MKLFLLSVLNLVARFIQARLQIRLDYYQEAQYLYRARRLADNPSSEMDSGRFNEFTAALAIFDRKNAKLLSVEEAAGLYIQCFALEVRYAREITELEKSVAVYQLVAAMFG